MLSGAVNPCKGLFVKQAGKPVTACHLFHNLHNQLIMIHCYICGFINRRQLMLRWSHLIMLGLSCHAQLPQLDINILHIRADSLSDASKVVVLKLLTLRCRGAKQGSSGKNQVLY